MKFTPVKSDTQPRLGKLVYQCPINWKISALAELPSGVMLGIYDNVSRRDSKILWNGKVVARLVDGVMSDNFNAETIGQPLIVGNYAIAAGECGYLVAATGGRVFEHEKAKLKWATTCALYAGVAYVFDSDGEKNTARDCITGETAFIMPGTGIIMAATEFNFLMWAAMADSDDGKHGVSCSNGRLWRADACMCIVNAWGRLLFSSGNKVSAMDPAGPVLIKELPCEKIMHMAMCSGRLRIAGANPDTAWEADCHGNLTTIGTFTDGNAAVGGSCFRVRISDRYFARAFNGVTGQVYEVI